MRAKIESAVFSHKFGNPEISVHNVVAGGVKYQCWQPTVLNKVGQEIDFEVIPAKDSKYPARMKITSEAGSGGGFKKSFTPSFKDTREGIVVSSKTMLLSYCKDISINKIPAGLNIDKVTEDIKTTFRELLPLLELDSMCTATNEVNNSNKHTLSPVIKTLLSGKMKSHNYRAEDMIDHAGLVGIELKMNRESGEVIWDISETDAKKLINSFSSEGTPF